MERKAQRGTGKQGNQWMGMMGVLFGSFPGVACIVGLDPVSEVSAMYGMLLSICTMAGYLLLGGALTPGELLRHAALMIGMAWVANRLTLVRHPTCGTISVRLTGGVSDSSGCYLPERTRTIQVPTAPFGAVTVMVVRPEPVPVTFPVLSTVAIEESEEENLTPSLPCALRVKDSPTTMDTSVLFSDRVSVGAEGAAPEPPLQNTIQVAVFSPAVQVMVTERFLSAVLTLTTFPLPSTVAISGLEEVQLTAPLQPEGEMVALMV